MRHASPPEYIDPHALLRLSTAPLAGVMAVLVAVWIFAIPKPQHSVALDLDDLLDPDTSVLATHTITVDADGSVSWDGEVVPGRAALDARMRTIGTQDVAVQPKVYVKPHQQAHYGAVAAVMAAAQRNDVRRVGMIDDRFVIPAVLRMGYL